MAYKPYPIYDMRAGKILNRDPWLLPADAFETLKDCYLKDGVLEKRRGYSKVGQIVHISTSTKAPTLSTDPVMGIFNHLTAAASEELIVMDKKRVNKYETSSVVGLSVTLSDAGGGEVNAECEGHGLVTDDVVTVSDSATLDTTYSITKVDDDNFKFTATWHASNSTATASQEQFNDLTEEKLHFSYKNSGGSTVQAHTLVVGDTVKGATSGATATVAAIIIDNGAWASNTASGTIIFTKGSKSGTFEAENITDVDDNLVGYIAAASSDEEFTGDNTNYFHIANWDGTTYITNNNDVIQKYDGSHLASFYIDLDTEGGPDNDITRCKFIIQTKRRIILFDITERGTAYKQRARWCEVDTPGTWKDASYIDADTSEEMMGAKFLGDDLIVWFTKSVWKFTYTANSDNPFRWERIDEERGCIGSPNSLMLLDDDIIVPGQTSLNACNGHEARAFDAKIPEFLLSWNQDSLGYCQALKIEEERQGLLAYASSDASANADGNNYPDSALVYNYEDKNFAVLTLPIHTFGSSKMEIDLNWLDITSSWTESDWAWSSKTNSSGYPTSMFGSQDGKVYKMNDGGSDDGSAIEFQAISGRWNPFILQGYEARLGWIDFLVDVNANVSISIKHYINTVTTAVQTKTITCTAKKEAEGKVWHRVYINCDAIFHRIEITNNAVSKRARIHAIVPYFERAGMIL
jgi:hypothetical protein